MSDNIRFNLAPPEQNNYSTTLEDLLKDPELFKSFQEDRATWLHDKFTEMKMQEMVELALNYDSELETNDKTRYESSLCAKLLLLSNSVVQKFFFEINQDRGSENTSRKKSSMNLEPQEGLKQTIPVVKKERYNPVQPKGDTDDDDEDSWFSDQIPVRRRKSSSTKVDVDEEDVIEEVGEEDYEEEPSDFDMENIEDALDEFNKIHEEEIKDEVVEKKLEIQESIEEPKIESPKLNPPKKQLSFEENISIKFPQVDDKEPAESEELPRAKKRLSLSDLLNDDLEKFPDFNSEDPSSPKGILQDLKLLTLKKTGSLILDDDYTYKPYSNKLEDKKEKSIYKATDNFKDMLVRTMKVCPIEDATHYRHIKPVKLNATAGNNLIQLLNGLFYVQPFSMLDFFNSLVKVGVEKKADCVKSPLENKNLSNFTELMKFCSMQEFLFTMINLAEIEFSENNSKLKTSQEKVLENFYLFIQILLEHFVRQLFIFERDNIDGFFSYDMSIDQEIVNENILRLFWNIAIHILFADEFESLKSNICVAKFILSETLYKIIQQGMETTIQRGKEFFNLRGGQKKLSKNRDFELRKQFFERNLRTQMRFLQLMNGIYSYFMTGKPSFQLKLDFSKEGEMKIPEFYNRIIDNFETFEDFYSSTSFKKVENFNAEYILNNRFVFQSRFKQIIDFQYLTFLMNKVSTDWKLKRKGSRTDGTGNQVPILGYDNLSILDYLVGLFELNKKLKNKEKKNKEKDGTKDTMGDTQLASNISQGGLSPAMKPQKQKNMVSLDTELTQEEKMMETQMTNIVSEVYTLLSDMFGQLRFHNHVHKTFVFFVSMLIKSAPESSYFKLLIQENSLSVNLSNWVNPEYCESRLYNKKMRKRKSNSQTKSGNYGFLRIIGNLITRLKPEKKQLLTMVPEWINFNEKYLKPQNALLSKNRLDSFFRKKKRQSIHLKFENLEGISESELTNTLEKMGAFEMDSISESQQSIYNSLSEELSPSSGGGSFGSFEELDANGNRFSPFALKVSRVVPDSSFKFGSGSNTEEEGNKPSLVEEDFDDEDMEEEPNYKFGGDGNQTCKQWSGSSLAANTIQNIKKTWHNSVRIKTIIPTRIYTFQ